MDISYKDEKGKRIVSISGRMDTLTAPAFDKEGAGWIDSGHVDVILDLDNLEYISSAGLRSILSLAKKVSALGGALSICGMKGVVEEVFAISGFDSFLPVFKTKEEALESK